MPDSLRVLDFTKVTDKERIAAKKMFANKENREKVKQKDFQLKVQLAGQKLIFNEKDDQPMQKGKVENIDIQNRIKELDKMLGEAESIDEINQIEAQIK